MPAPPSAASSSPVSAARAATRESSSTSRRSTSRSTSRQVLITGGTAGIGRAAAIELARRGAAVTIMGRDAARGREVVAAIEREAPGAVVEFAEVDLADLASVRSAAAGLLERHAGIDVLIANAGVHEVSVRHTVDGFDHMLASNYLGHFLLTSLLLGPLRAAAPSRIVVVASEAYRLAGRLDPERFEDLGDYGRLASFRAYGRTKLLEILWDKELSNRLESAGVAVNSVDPGTVSTGLYADIPGVRRIAPRLARTPAFRTPEEGARMIVFLALDPEFDDITGRYFSSVRALDRLPEIRVVRDVALRRRVWERTEKLLSEH